MKVSEYDFECFFLNHNDGVCTMYELPIDYDEMERVIAAIFSVLKKKGIIIADWSDLNSDEGTYCFYALGNEVYCDR